MRFSYQGEAGLDNVCQLLAVAREWWVLAAQDLQDQAALQHVPPISLRGLRSTGSCSGGGLLLHDLASSA